MNIFTNKNKSKKFIIVLVVLILFNICYPKQVHAFDFGGNISSFFFMLEKGIINFVNDIFCDAEHEFELTSPDPKKQQVNFTAENIIKGKFILFDANIFRKIGDGDYYDKFDWLVGEDGAKNTLRNTISGWYYSLRNFAIIALLSVLVYVGIRMITSTISQDKAKYKIMFKDWLVALCLLIIMHYIMIGILNVTSMVTNAIGIDGGGGTQTGHIMSIIHNINEVDTSIEGVEGDDWGDVRYVDWDDGGKKYTLEDAFAYELLLLAIILLTFLFAWKYMKREFTIIFLILLGPISCITYPIDKISDGKAQAFNKWLTEFIYNVLVQPFHLLLYTVLCGSAIELANNNILYGLACLAMLIPAEKFVKEMFGFKDHLGGGPLAAATTGAVASQLMNKVKGLGSGKSSGGTGGSDNNNNTATKIKNKNVDRSVLTDGQTGSGDENPEIEEGNPPQTVEENDVTEIEEGESPQAVEEKDVTETEEGNPPQTVEENDVTEIEEGNPPQTVEEKGVTETEEGNTPKTAEEKDEEKEPSETEGDNNPLINGGEETSETQGDNKSKHAGFGKRLLDAHNERVTEKWGTADRKKRWKKRGIKGVKSLGKGAYKAAKGSLKMAGALAGASVGAAVGLLSGKGIAAGAAAGYKLTGSAINKAEKSVSGVVNDYRDRMQTPEQREKKQKKAFAEDKNERKNAIESFKERHEGRGPSDSEFEKEMEDRYELKSYGMTNEEINDSLPIYQKHLQEQINNGKSEEEAKKIAASKTVTSAKWKKRISADKFTDPKTMQNAVDSISKSLQTSTKCSKDVADEYARQYLADAGEMHGLKKEEIALPPQKIPETFARQMLRARGVSKPSKQQLQRAEEVHIKLKQKGYDQNQIKQVMSNMKFEDNVSELEFTRQLKVYVDYDKNKNEMGAITEFLGDKASDKEIRQEYIERMEVKKIFGLEEKENTTKVSAIRALEENKGSKKNRKLAKRVIDGDISKKEWDETNIKDMENVDTYKKLINGDTSAIREELKKHGEKKNSK